MPLTPMKLTLQARVGIASLQFFYRAAFEELAELRLGPEAHRHAALTVRD